MSKRAYIMLVRGHKAAWCQSSTMVAAFWCLEGLLLPWNSIPLGYAPGGPSLPFGSKEEMNRTKMNFR
ncbi:MAG: hypothetical protein PVF58_09425 [Candidatus Methanofastidiosia archaeon]|jgi:hypothetical protein